jgi:predicted negative regulator of RcsB-dependent stress response
MFRKNDFDTALKFTKNLKYDEQLLAEISRLHGDYLYNKEEFTKAIEHYKLSIKHLEPSYVIKRFLDV